MIIREREKRGRVREEREEKDECYMPLGIYTLFIFRISQEMSRRCHFIDSLCRRGNLTLINPPPISLVPVTVGHVMNADKSRDNRKE